MGIKMKTRKKVFGFGLVVVMLFSLCVTSIAAFAEQESVEVTDTNNFECVGTVTEDFNGVEDVDALYAKTTSGTGDLSGKWQLTKISHVGQGRSEMTTHDGSDKALNMVTTNGAAEPGGVDFVFDTPLAPEYILEVSYDLCLNGTSATVALTNGNYTNNESAGFCNMREDGLFRIFSGNGGGTGVEAYAGVISGTITVKGVYNLLSWTYDAEVYQNGTKIAGVTAGRMGPMVDGGPVCKPGTTYEKLSFFTQVGTAWVDNISVKAYKPTSEFALEMSETFDGKTVGAMSNVHVENGMGSWVANTLWGGGYEYAEYINSNGNTDIGIRASGAWNRVQYVPGVNFNKLYDNNSEVIVKFDFIVPNADPQGWMIMEWGDGFTDEHRNVPFFALNANGDKWALTYPNDTAPGTEMFASPLASLERGKTYTFEGTIYPAREMTSAVVKEGDTTVCKGSYKGGQWRKYTDGLNVHTMSMTNDGTPGVIFDNFSISSKEAPPYDPNVLVDKVDFSDCSSVADLRALGFLIVDSPENNISVGTAFENDPQSPSMCLGSAAHGANFPVLPAAANEGAYKVSYWAYDSGPAGLLVVDAPMILNSFDNGSLGLLRVESNRAYLGDTAITELQTGTWYRFENIIDLDARKVSAAVYTESGAQMGKTVRTDFKNFTPELSTDLIDHFIGIRFRNWGLDTNVYIDNIEANRYFVTPTLTDKKISFSMFDGTTVSEKEGIKPEVESIVLDFGASVTEESAAEGIHLSKADGTTVAFTGSANSGKYFMKLDRLPEPNSSYLLTVDGSVKTKDGKSLGSSFSYTFTTGQGDFFCKLISVQKDGEILENMTGVPGSSELTIELKYANPLLSAKKVECIVNYYDSKHRTIGKTIHEITAEAGSAKTMSLTAKAVPEDCDSIQILLWDDLESMIAYTDGVTFVTE